MDQINMALQCDRKDNVATVFANEIKSGMTIQVRDTGGNTRLITVLDDVPYGHKVALCDIEKTEHVVKYGEPIGAAIRKIRVGEHVHVHNIEALRGRGDL